jgi:hypothetical protein
VPLEGKMLDGVDYCFLGKKCHFRWTIYHVEKCNLAQGLGVCDWEDMRVIRDLETKFGR